MKVMSRQRTAPHSGLHPDLREKVENGTAVSSAVAQMLM